MLWPPHLNGWVGFSGVIALLSRYAASGAPLTLIPEPHPPLLRLLDDLYAGASYFEVVERCRRRETRKKNQGQIVYCVVYMYKGHVGF